MKIDSAFIELLKKSTGQIECSTEELKNIYDLLDHPNSRLVRLYDNYFVSFTSTPTVQFKLTDATNIDSFNRNELHLFSII